MLIHKYSFRYELHGLHEVVLPIGSKILSVKSQCGVLVMWYSVPNDFANSALCTHRYGFYHTGFDDVPSNARFIDTFLFSGDMYILHMFEL